MPIRSRGRSSKNPPILSHEFFIQNHADIVSCVAMVFVLGLLFQATSHIASMFVVMSHNTTSPDAVMEEGEPFVMYYTVGLKDIALVSFYTLICIVMHAVVQEYVLDKLNRKLHLSKIKHSKFNESGQLLIFYLISLVWAVEVVRREPTLLTISSLWTSYPHLEMSHLFKFYFIIQISYWIHAFPELYFQKVKKDEINTRVTYSTLYLLFFSMAYILNLNRIALILSVIHYAVEALFHLSRLFYFADKSNVCGAGFQLWNILFVLVRLVSITLSVLTFWFGLSLSPSSSANVSLSEGNYNTPLIRLNCLLAVGLLQAWMMWNFITFHLKRLREKASAAKEAKKKLVKKNNNKIKENETENQELSDGGDTTSNNLTTNNSLTTNSLATSNSLGKRRSGGAKNKH